MNALSLIFFVSILSLSANTLYNLNAERDESLISDGVASTITQIARAQHRHLSNNPGTGYFTVLTGNVPGWSASTYDASNYNTEAIPTNPNSGFIVQYDTQGKPAIAAQIAQRFGPIACVGDPSASLGLPDECNGADNDTITVYFARSLDLTLVDQFLPMNGERPMIGSLKIGGVVGDISTGTNVTPAGHITTRGMLNVGIDFNDNDNDGEIDPGETVTGEGVLITSDGNFLYYNGVFATVEMNNSGVRIGESAGTTPIIDTGASIIGNFSSIDGGQAAFDDIIINP